MDRTEALLTEMRAYLRVMAASNLRAVEAGRVIDTYEKAVLYSKLDGNTTQLRLQEIVGVPQPTISVWLTRFTEAGIVTPPNEAYRNHRALFTLQELGVNMAALKKRVPSAEPTPVEATEAA
jgi:DNA-binding transcriptional ArsR family regulator